MAFQTLILIYKVNLITYLSSSPIHTLGNFEQLIYSACIASYVADTRLVAADTMMIKIDMVLSSWNVQSTGNIAKLARGQARVC